MLRKKYILIVLAVLMATACAKDDGSGPGTGPGTTAGDTDISFSYADPAVATRTGTVAASDAEKLIRDMDVFMFLSDGTFVRRLAADDYASSNDGTRTTITLAKLLFADYGGREAVFYFVANNAASTGGAHIVDFTGTTEDEFRELLSAPLPLSTSTVAPYAGKSVNITIASKTGGLLMTGRSNVVALSGKHTETVVLKRRVARFDLLNPKWREGISVDNFYVTDAATQATLFGNSAEPHDIPVNSTLIHWGPDSNSKYYDENDMAKSVLYLYPTTLAMTKIAVEVRSTIKDSNGKNVTVRKTFHVDSDIAIEANRRYTLILREEDLIVDSDTGDWEEGGSGGVTP